jgi:hypothetical protein
MLTRHNINDRIYQIAFDLYLLICHYGMSFMSWKHVGLWHRLHFTIEAGSKSFALAKEVASSGRQSRRCLDSLEPSGVRQPVCCCEECPQFCICFGSGAYPLARTACTCNREQYISSVIPLNISYQCRELER